MPWLPETHLDATIGSSRFKTDGFRTVWGCGHFLGRLDRVSWLPPALVGAACLARRGVLGAVLLADAYAVVERRRNISTVVDRGRIRLENSVETSSKIQ